MGMGRDGLKTWSPTGHPSLRTTDTRLETPAVRSWVEAQNARSLSQLGDPRLRGPPRGSERGSELRSFEGQLVGSSQLAVLTEEREFLTGSIEKADHQMAVRVPQRYPSQNRRLTVDIQELVA